MAIIINLDMMLAKRKMSSAELASRIGIIIFICKLVIIIQQLLCNSFYLFGILILCH